MIFFRFPLKNEELTKRWLANMRRDKWKPTAHSYICSSHFEDKYMYATNNQKRLLASAIPTLFSFPEHLQKTKTPARRSPKKRQIPESTSIEDMSSCQAGKGFSFALFFNVDVPVHINSSHQCSFLSNSSSTNT